MGNKYYVKAWGQHDGEVRYSDREMWRGQSLLSALYMLWKTKRQGYGCVTLECR